MSRSRREGGAVHRRRFCVSVSVWFPTVTVTWQEEASHLAARLRLVAERLPNALPLSLPLDTIHVSLQTNS